MSHYGDRDSDVWANADRWARTSRIEYGLPWIIISATVVAFIAFCVCFTMAALLQNAEYAYRCHRVAVNGAVLERQFDWTAREGYGCMVTGYFYSRNRGVRLETEYIVTGVYD